MSVARRRALTPRSPDPRATDLGALAASFGEVLLEIDPATLPDYNLPPFASLQSGAAGVAFCLWKLGGHAPAALRARLWAGARRWLAHAREAARSETGYFQPEVELVDPPRARQSLFFGEPGVLLVEALIDGDGDGAEPMDARRGFLRACQRCAEAPPEFTLGRAGLLAGMETLASLYPDSGLAAASDLLADSLREDARRGRAGDPRKFAHGARGVHAVLFRWYARREQAAPGWLIDAVVADLDPALPHVAARRLGICVGESGRALLAVAAYEATGEIRFANRAAALISAMTAQAATDLSICCGAGGRALATLVLARATLEPAWHDRAIVMIEPLWELPTTSWGLGCMTGHAGLACLAATVADPTGNPPVLPWLC